ILAALIINSLVPPVYQAETTIRIKQPRGLENSLLADMPGGSMNRQLFMSTYAEMLKNRTVVAAVIDEMESQQGKKPALGSITTQPVKDTELMRITVQAQTPAEAQLAADILVRKFVEQTTFFARSEQTAVREFIATRLQEAKRDLEKSENALQLYQRKEKIILPHTGTSAMLDRLSAISNLKAGNTVALSSAQAKLANVQRNLVQEKVISVADNALIQQYKANLANFELDLVGLLGKYTEKHPEVIAA
ncbi:MAG TPA: lipopolysaccharide biosynthesis protein, partial [Firmicutes bacterium]|nr:lipopolysaccharide biosynthesis protein [Bacillota bacterium]